MWILLLEIVINFAFLFLVGPLLLSKVVFKTYREFAFGFALWLPLCAWLFYLLVLAGVSRAVCEGVFTLLQIGSLVAAICLLVRVMPRMVAGVRKWWAAMGEGSISVWYRPDFQRTVATVLVALILICGYKEILAAIKLPLVALLNMPIGNDWLQYGTIASLAYERWDFAFYPMAEADPSGFYVACTHAAGMPASISLMYFLFPDGMEFATRFPGWHSIVGLVLIVWRLCRYRISGLLFFLFFLGGATALISAHSVHHIDIRYATLLVLGGGLLSVFVENGRKRYFYTAVCSIGLAAFYHSLGFVFGGLTIAIFFVFYLFLGHPKRVIIHLVWSSAIILVVFGFGHYLWNYIRVGALFGDTVAIWEHYSKENAEFLAATRFLEPGWERFVKGGLQIFNRSIFGVGAYVGFLIFSIWLILKRNRLRQEGGVLLIVAPAFVLFGLMLYAGATDSFTDLIKNYRYCIFPFFAILTGGSVVVSENYEKIRVRVRTWLASLWRWILMVEVRLRVMKLQRSVCRWVCVFLVLSFGCLVLILASNSRSKLKIVRGLVGHKVSQIALNESRISQVPAHQQSDRAMRFFTPFPEYLESGDKVLLYRMSVVSYFLPEISYIRYLDPRMQSVYVAESSADCLRRLKELGITHIAKVPYKIFPLDGLVISEIIDDFTEVVWDSQGYELLKIDYSSL